MPNKRGRGWGWGWGDGRLLIFRFLSRPPGAPFINFQEMIKYKNFSAAKWVFRLCFSFNLELHDFFCNVLFFDIQKLIWLIIFLDLLSLLICLILLIITLFLLASLRVCLLNLKLSISIKDLCLFSFITDIIGFFEIPTPVC